MRGGEGDTVPVDLVEVDSPDALRPPLHAVAPGDDPSGDPGSPGGSGGDPTPEARAHRRRRRVLLAVGAGVVLALAVTGGVLTALDERRAEARWDALAERGMPLVDLSAPLEEVWRLPGGGWPMATTSEVMVLQTWDQVGGVNVWRAVDTATGEVAWERTEPGDGWCSQWNPQWSDLTSEEAMVAFAFAAAGGGVPDASMLICSSGPGFGGELPAAGEQSTLTVLDVRSGAELASVDLPGALVTFDPVEEDLVAATVTPEGAIQLTRRPLAGGPPVWSTTTEVMAVDDDGYYAGAWPSLYDGTVLLLAPGGGLVEAIDMDTGEPTTAEVELPTASGGWQVLPDGTRVDMSYGDILQEDGVSYVVGDPSVTVTGPDGTERFEAPGGLWSPWYTDGSLPDRILVGSTGDNGTGGSLSALDVVTGDELWTVPMRWSTALVQVDGVAVAGSGYAAGVDLRTGEELWQHRATLSGAVSPVTDGSRVVLPTTDGAVTSLVAREIRSGAETWRVPTLSNIQLLNVVGDGVLVGNDTELVYYR
ncbi:outer membrane protein assembly factor BamB family protein [Actinotalea fermentans]|uniref:Pyrrolo-quinoline quinone repeat domain-containing protein n=1 Tax=Actinotalea fermentans TaxID=43671 RepID=A0A511YTQ0_9CELL|nr:PQQ-binding-like beta-propeller repeat protein [Actinotalea fermentans]KGM17755.1 hypothetical protein N867_13705 [Actinotalea fermentans ATCC 43279 = JCM 9966 = DSM 3133]GEN78577.1 hypothetical protein AFE02nite_03110 [Actinotalea fermentans]